MLLCLSLGPSCTSPAPADGRSAPARASTSAFGFYGPLELSPGIGDHNALVKSGDYATLARTLREAGASWVYAFDVSIHKGGLPFVQAFVDQGFFVSGGIPNGFGRLEDSLFLPRDLVAYRSSLRDYFQKYSMIEHWQLVDEWDGTYFKDTAENAALMFRMISARPAGPGSPGRYRSSLPGATCPTEPTTRRPSPARRERSPVAS